MAEDRIKARHSAEASALGFYYQTFFALVTLLEQRTDNAAVGVEQLDDVNLKVDGQTLLFQLKHSIIATPPPLKLKSRALWRTMKAWIDALPGLNLPETRFHLVTVAEIPSGSVLEALTSPDGSRDELAKAMTEEAQRVVNVRAAAAKKGEALPHADRVDGCEAFLALSEAERLNFLRCTLIKQASPQIGRIEDQVAGHLKIVHPGQRPLVARRLIEWWDRQVVYSLCNKRERVISRAELQQHISIIIADIEHDILVPDFEAVSEPEGYQPNGMLTRQIRLVNGRQSDISKAIREEWRAREQRSLWLNEKPSMAAVIGEYDRILQEYWSDRHRQIVEDCEGLEDEERCAYGLKILRWTHDEAPNCVRPIANNWAAAYYVRGSYQVLAINLEVGWHPDYKVLLGGEE